MKSREGWKGFATQPRTFGFSLLEMMVALVILLSVTAIVMTAMNQMMKTQGTLANRTELHSSVRSVTEVLQQEIGQAGRIPPLPNLTTLTANVAAGSLVTATMTPAGAAAAMFNGELLVVDAGQMGAGFQNPETVTISNVNSGTNTFQATFVNPHLAGAPVVVAGAFPSGIIPTDATYPSTGSVLKMFGDINGDGNMVYIEYNCDTAGGTLTRSVTQYTAATKSVASIILPNIRSNPPASSPTPCFQYQQKPNGTASSSVVDVTITLSVNTQNVDPQTKVVQTETNALLNVAPRNVFDAWLLSGGSVTNRLQPMPATVLSLSSQ